MSPESLACISGREILVTLGLWVIMACLRPQSDGRAVTAR
jgi:hypothetical protein